jgi:hypothetical protein
MIARLVGCYTGPLLASRDHSFILVKLKVYSWSGVCQTWSESDTTFRKSKGAKEKSSKKTKGKKRARRGARKDRSSDNSKWLCALRGSASAMLDDSASFYAQIKATATAPPPRLPAPRDPLSI